MIGLTTLGVLIALYNKNKKEEFVDDEKTTPTEQKKDFNEQHIVEDEEIKNPQPELKDSIETEIVETPPPPEKENLPKLPEKNIPKKNKKPDIPQEDIVGNSIDSISMLQRFPEIDDKEYSNIPIVIDESNESLTFRDSFQYQIDIGGMELADLIIEMEDINGDTLTVEYAPQQYYVARLPKYPNGIYFDFTSDYPTGKNPVRSQVDTDLAPNPVLEKYYEEQNMDGLPIKLIGKKDGSNKAGLTCRCGVLGKNYDQLVYKIFTNKKTDFDEQKYITEEPCAKQQRINISFNGFNLGLHYIVFENKATGEILAVDKFEITGEDSSPQLPDENIPIDNNSQAPKTAVPEDLSPNPFLENYIGSNIAGNIYKVGIITDSVYRYNHGRVNADISITTKIGSKPILVFSIYTNQASDFETQQPLINKKIDLNNPRTFESDNLLHLNCPIYANFKLGLYYVVIQSQDGEIWAVDKFEVKAEE